MLSIYLPACFLFLPPRAGPSAERGSFFLGGGGRAGDFFLCFVPFVVFFPRPVRGSLCGARGGYGIIGSMYI